MVADVVADCAKYVQFSDRDCPQLTATTKDKFQMIETYDEHLFDLGIVSTISYTRSKPRIQMHIFLIKSRMKREYLEMSNILFGRFLFVL
jgi:hypothetical protein